MSSEEDALSAGTKTVWATFSEWIYERTYI